MAISAAAEHPQMRAFGRSAVAARRHATMKRHERRTQRRDDADRLALTKKL